MRTKVSSTARPKIIHLPVGLALTAAYGYWAVESNTHPHGLELIEFLVSFWLIAAIVFFYWWCLGKYKIKVEMSTVILWAVVFHVMGILGSPILEDDFYRYLLDGCVFVNTGSPYGITPTSLFFDNSLPPECQSLLNWVNNPDLPTIYPPLLQYVFGVSHLVYPVNINALQIFYTLVDLSIIYLLGKIAPARNVLLFAWSPLVIKEFAFTVHPDVLGAGLLIFAFIARKYHRSTLACVLTALACCTKILAIVAIPFILHRQPLRNWIIFATTILLVYSPFILQGNTDLPVLFIFAEVWQFNAFAFKLVSLFFSDEISRLICASIFLIWFGFYLLHWINKSNLTSIPRFDWVFGVFLLLSPVINAWYFIWVLPFVVLKPSYWGWTASVVLHLSYVTGLHLENSILGAYQVATPAWTFQMLAIGIALAIDYWRHLQKNGPEN